MKERLRQRWRESLGVDVVERVDEVSPDLPYELQSKMFDQLATVSVAGAGLSVTLIGSLVRNSSPLDWFPVFLFATAAVFAVSGNSKLIDGLFRRRPCLRQSKVNIGLAIGLVGMAIGSLSMTVYYSGERASSVERAAR